MDNRYKWQQQRMGGRGGGGGGPRYNNYGKHNNNNNNGNNNYCEQQQHHQQHQQQHHPSLRDCGGGGGAWQPVDSERSSDVITLIVENNNLKRMILLHVNLMQEQTDQLKAKDKELDDQCGCIKTLLSQNQELMQQIAKLTQRIDDLRQQLRMRVKRPANDNDEMRQQLKAKLQCFAEKETQTSLDLQEEEDESLLQHCYPSMQSPQHDEQPPNVLVTTQCSKGRGEFNGGKKVSTIFLHRVNQESSFQLQHGEEEHELEEDVDVDGVMEGVEEGEEEEEVEEQDQHHLEEQHIYHDGIDTHEMEVVTETEIGAEEELPEEATEQPHEDIDPVNNGHIYEEEVVAEEIINNCDEHNLWQAGATHEAEVPAAAVETEQVVEEEQQHQIYVTEEGDIDEVATFAHSTPHRPTSRGATQEQHEEEHPEQQQEVVEEAIEESELHLEYAMKQLNDTEKECRQLFIDYQEEQQAFEHIVSRNMNHTTPVKATTELEEVASPALLKTQIKLPTVASKVMVANHQETKQHQHQKERLVVKTKQKATTTTPVINDKELSGQPWKQERERELQQKVRDLKKEQELLKERQLQQERELQLKQEQEKQKELELQKERELEAERELQKQREEEEKQELERARKLQKEQELQKQLELQKQQEQQERELAKKRERELAEQKERELAEQKERELQREKELKREQRQREREKERERERKQREQRKREQQESKRHTATKQPELEQQPEPNIEEEVKRKLQAHLQKEQQRLHQNQQLQQQPFVRLKKATLQQAQSLIYPPTITPAPSPTYAAGASPKLKINSNSTITSATTVPTVTTTPLTPQSISSVGSNSNSKSDSNISSNSSNNNNRRTINNCAPQTYSKAGKRSNSSTSRYVTSLQPYTTRSWEDQEFHCDNEFFLEEAEELLADHPSLEIPKWKIVKYSPSSDNRGIESISDADFVQLHEKQVRDEVDRKKRDARAIRDQNYYESLRQRHNQDEVLVPLAPLPTSTFYPLPNDIEYVQFVSEVPVQAFGENMINLKPENEHFTLPWLDAATATTAIAKAKAEALPVATLDSKKLPTTNAEAKILQNNSSYVFLKRRKRQRKR
ncbi:protein male-specific lethal-1 [Drosophila nasuta]|uniref:protein male-specific lethal-1 n=1 Tax=Drosophila nasuta TaxID=42062 RepID=UPI00295F3E72|nr:protein male-specific lethal-1 [Drosophila nasuta]